MFKKLIAVLRNGPGTNEILDKIIGVILLIVFISMVYLAGVGDGRISAKTELSNLAQLDSKMDRIQKMIDADRRCETSKPGKGKTKGGNNHV